MRTRVLPVIVQGNDREQILNQLRPPSYSQDIGGGVVTRTTSGSGSGSGSTSSGIFEMDSGRRSVLYGGHGYGGGGRDFIGEQKQRSESMDTLGYPEKVELNVFLWAEGGEYGSFFFQERKSSPLLSPQAFKNF